MTSMLEKAVEQAGYVAESALGRGHNAPVREIVIAVLETIREPGDELKATIEIARPYLKAFPDSAPETFWGQMIDAILAGEESKK